MKMKYILLAVFSLFVMTSCSDWLKIETDDRIMEDKLFSTREGFLIAQNGIYIELLSKSLYNGSLNCTGVDVMAQYWKTNEKEHSYKGLSDFEIINKTNLSGSLWSAIYGLLPNVNTLLARCEEQQGILSEKDYFMIKGEMLAMRALLHFELLRFFGPVFKEDNSAVTIPYVDDSEITIRPLLKASEVADKILKDLYEAEKTLIVDPIIEDGPKAEEVELESNDYKFRNMRLNYFAVQALIARVALHVNKKDIAYSYAKKVIKSVQEEKQYFPFTTRAEIDLTDDADKVFSSEILFGLYNSKRAEDLYLKIFSPDTDKNRFLSIYTPSIETIFDGVNADLRRIWFVEKVNIDAEIVSCFTRFDRSNVPSTDMVNRNKQYYIPIIRISEMYMIIAECTYETAPDEAISAISTVRKARSLPAIDDKNIFQSLQKEITRDFIGEGQLFWFYKRNKFTSIPRLSYDNQTVATDTNQFLFTIPENEAQIRKFK